METQTNTQVKVGDIFVSSWGYGQVNVGAYKVVALTPSGKSVKIVEIGTRPDDRYHVIPTPESVIGGEMTKRIRIHPKYGVSIKICSCESADPWDGTPQFQTPFGEGH